MASGVSGLARPGNDSSPPALTPARAIVGSGRQRSISGPTGTMPVGLRVRWLS
jgi:hypothetical protein